MLNVNQKESRRNSEIDINIDDQGFLISPDEWSEAFAASALGLMPRSLSSQHKDILQYVRNKYLHLGVLPPLNEVCESIGMEKSMLIVLFGSCFQLCRAAGLPRPDDELGAHMN